MPNIPASPTVDRTSLLSDALLFRIFSLLPPSALPALSLVSRRWLQVSGRLCRRLTVVDPSFLSALRLSLRFPHLTHLVVPPPSSRSSAVITAGDFSFAVRPFADEPILGSLSLPPDGDIDRGLCAVADACPELVHLSCVAPAASDYGLAAVASGCPFIQQLELHYCTDQALRPVFSFCNLQILRVVGGGPRETRVTDIGLTILAHGCQRLVRLELSGCEGSYDGVSAIGRCCEMLEELTLVDHRMDNGWVAALAFCGNLKTLRLVGCKKVDEDPGSPEHLGACPVLEKLQLEQCQIRERCGLHALFLVCESAREILLLHCWGMNDEIFSFAAICRRVHYLSLEGCSLLTTQGLESVILSWKELQRLSVVSCRNMRDEDISPALSGLFCNLKELKWRPDTRSVLAASLSGTGMGKKGRRFFRRA